ncbi:MAG TPA: hypothetical protein VFK37_02380 [Bacillales bacterium]|nr:hypothetical protein [Bacillales bacterium]
MGYSKAKTRNISAAANSLQEECIRVPKVYDWVTDTLSVSRNIEFTEEQRRKIENAMDDPSRRPLRIVCESPNVPPLFSLNETGHDCESNFLCEQVGEKRNVTVPIGGEFVDAQLVDLLFTTDIRIKVVDRNGREVVALNANASVFESFVLCFPDGTTLMCDISKIFCRIPSGTVLLNAPSPSSFTLEVTFCVDIQVEAEVKLEILARFCSPRANDITAPEMVEQCPPITFPAQCNDIFPRPACECSASGEASGNTGSEATEQGEAGVNVNICPNCSLTNTSLAFTFDDRDTSDGLKNFTFTASEFDPETLDCKKVNGGLQLTISGSGETDTGEHLDFNFAVVDSRFGDQFQFVLINEDTGDVVFDSGPVNVTEGDLAVQKCE